MLRLDCMTVGYLALNLTTWMSQLGRVRPFNPEAFRAPKVEGRPAEPLIPTVNPQLPQRFSSTAQAERRSTCAAVAAANAGVSQPSRNARSISARCEGGASPPSGGSRSRLVGKA